MKFGLNRGYCDYLTMKTTKDGVPYVEVKFMIDDKFFKQQAFFAKDYVYVKGEKSSDQEDIRKHNDGVVKWAAHIARAVVGFDEVKKVLDQDMKFSKQLEAICDLVPNRAPQEIDIFLEYQYSPREGQNRTYLQVPNNLGSGFFCAKHEGDAKEVRVQEFDDKTDEALFYEVNGKKHAFKRNGWYMGSNFAKQQGQQQQQQQQPQPKVTVEAGDFDDLPF